MDNLLSAETLAVFAAFFEQGKRHQAAAACRADLGYRWAVRVGGGRIGNGGPGGREAR